MTKRRTRKEQRMNKQYVERLLLIQGIDYDDWLDDIHVEYLEQNNKLILDALDTVLTKKEEKKKQKQQQQEKQENHNNNHSFKKHNHI